MLKRFENANTADGAGAFTSKVNPQDSKRRHFFRLACLSSSLETWKELVTS